MRSGSTLVVAALIMSTAGGCAAPWHVGPDLQGNATEFNLVSTDVTMAVALQFDPSASRYGRRLVADLGRCHVVGDDDGRSGLSFPLGPADPPPSLRTSAAITVAAVGGSGGGIDLIRAGDKHVRLPEPGGQFSYAMMLPLFLVQPFDVLPDRLETALTGPQPPAPAEVELARDLVDCPAVGVAGTLAGAGVFSARLSLTDAGRAKLRSALARRAAATTRPA